MLSEKTFTVSPVGYVRRLGAKTCLEILESYVPALKQAEHFSHLQVLWWFSASQADEQRATTQAQPPYANAPVAGVFALRAPKRPNPIGLTTVKVLSVDHKRGLVEVADIDAFDGTPILDIKAYIPVEDRVKDARTPDWMAGWPEWMPEDSPSLSGDGQAALTPGATDFELVAVGHSRRGDKRTIVHILPPYIPALHNLEHFSHVRMLWWFHRLDDDRFRRVTHNKPPYENAPVTGVFASRSPVRPNPIGLSTARIVHVDHEHGIVELAATDAFDETPIVDLKPYIPASDRAQHFRVPAWIAHWPAWQQEAEPAEVVSASRLRPADSDRLAAFQAEQVEPPPALPCSPRLDGEATTTTEADAILIRGARQHNLKNIDVTIPRNKFTVITGVSGSGKSSLAFDTLYAEGRRRYVGSLSSLARRLIGQMEKPQVDHILGLAPTIAIEQGSISHNPRSTVGTATEVQDYLRVLFARAGVRHCPQCGRAVKPQTARGIADQLAGLIPGARFCVLAPLVRKREGTHADVLERVRAAGPARLRIDGAWVDAQTAPLALAETEPHTVEQLMGEFEMPTNGQEALRGQVFDAVEAGLKAGHGYLAVVLEGEEDVLLTQHMVCPHCDIFFFELSPALFSFNNPDGMCSDCNGLGVKLDVDPELVVTDPTKSLLDGASPWYGELRKVKPSGNWMRSELFALADVRHVDLELPWRDLPESFRQAILYGTGDEIIRWTYDMMKRGRAISFERPVTGAVNNIKRLLQQTQSEGPRTQLLKLLTPELTQSPRSRPGCFQPTPLFPLQSTPVELSACQPE